MALRGAVAALGLVLAGWPVAGLAQTVISPDVGDRGLGTTVGAAGTVFTVDGGTRAGTNLFHSFSQFSVGAGDTARWARGAGDGAEIRNVVNRVTGGQASTIGGTLDSTALPNASFYFINPAGIVFGAGAKVNVPAAAFFSTAAELRFADGAKFAIATPGGSTLSVAAPESFGFVGGQGAIRIDGAQILGGDARLAFAASDLDITGAQLFGASLDLTAVGRGGATVPLAMPPATANGAIGIQRSQVGVVASGGALRITAGAINLDGGVVVSDTAAATRGGDIAIRAGTLTARNTSTIGTSTRGGGAGGALTIDAGTVDADGGSFFSVGTGDGPAGRIAVTADIINLRGNLAVASTASGAGRGGDVALTATRDLTLDSAFAISSSLGVSRGGDVTLTAPNQQLFNALAVASSSEGGRPGNVMLIGETIITSAGAYGSVPGGASDSGDLTILASKSFESNLTSFTASTLSDNTAGSILIRSPLISMEQSFLTSSAFGNGGAGKVQVQGTDIFLSSTNLTAETRGADVTLRGLVELKATGRLEMFLTFLTSNANGDGNGGMVSLEGKDIVIDNSFVSSDTVGNGLGVGTGSGGLVQVKADTLALHLGRISSGTDTDGDAGNVSVIAGRLHLDQDSEISSNTTGFNGDAGSVTVKAGVLEVVDGSKITSEARGAFGAAGEVNIEADSIDLDVGFISSDTQSFGNAGAVRINVGALRVGSALQNMFTYISSDTLGGGAAGGVTIDAQTIELRNGGYVSSDALSQDSGNAGTVDIKAKSLTVSNTAYISSDTFGSGRAGDININADTLRVAGGNDGPATISSSSGFGDGDAGTINVIAKSLTLEDGGSIASDTFTFGDAGDIFIKADTFTARTEGGVSSRTVDGGNAGNIVVKAGALNLDQSGAITSEAVRGSLGAAGTIDVTADTVRLGDMARISTSSESVGDAGLLSVVARTSLTLEGGSISSAAERGATGKSGTLFIDVGALNVLGGGAISTTSFNSNPAGEIGIQAETVRVDGAGALISSENTAGNPMMGGRPGEGGDAGGIFIVTGGLTVSNGGRISTNAFAGAAGEIGIGITRPGLVLLEGADAPGVIQTSSGRATGGKITITDPLAIISNGGAILALGQQRGANVLIQSRYFINSTDRTNTVAVDGDFRLETGLYDVSSGTVSRDISVLDASKVLRGQCPAARSTGAVSQLITRPVGPYVREPDLTAPQGPVSLPAPSTTVGGACR